MEDKGGLTVDTHPGTVSVKGRQGQDEESGCRGEVLDREREPIVCCGNPERQTSRSFSALVAENNYACLFPQIGRASCRERV